MAVSISDPFSVSSTLQPPSRIEKDLHVSSKQEAYQIGIKHELAIKQFMSEVMLGEHTRDFDEARVRSLVSNVANKGIQQIDGVMQRIPKDAVFSAALI